MLAEVNPGAYVYQYADAQDSLACDEATRWHVIDSGRPKAA